MSEARRVSPLVIVVSAATVLVVLVCAIAAGSMLLASDGLADTAGARTVAEAPAAPAAGLTAASRDEAAGRPAPGAEAAAPEAEPDSERAAAEIAGALGASTCADAPADSVTLMRALAGLGDPGTWISRGVFDAAIGKPIETFAEKCGSGHVSSVLDETGLPSDVTGPLAAYVANGGARSTVDAAAARDALAVGVPADLLVSAKASRSVSEFMLPSGNIACRLSGNEVRCEIANSSFGDDPAGQCVGRWGGALVVAGGVGEPTCLESWSGLGRGTVLRYGESTRTSGYSCAATTEGVACRHDASGHGFWLRSSGYLVF
ncbi:hypothetical protein ACTVCO_11875 [Sanguibacter sp. A247]|uniref:hypothetical protein n=1 Tax=unclassified Sanguibacter TaxID=2645534 RepID=UPI003FD8A53C